MPKLSSHPRVVAGASAVNGQRTKFTITDAPGIILDCTPDGLRAWYARYQVGHGRGGRKQRFHRLGSFNDGDPDYMTLGQAKDRASELRTDAKRDGIDGFADERTPEGANLFGALFKDWLEKHAKVRKKTWEQDENLHKLYLAAALDKRPVAEITRLEISNVLDKIAKTAPRRADLATDLLSSMWNWAIDAGRADVNPAARQRPRHNGKPRTKVLTDDELRRVWHALDTRERGHQMARAIKLLIMTGARVNEVISAEKHEIAGDVWTKPAIRMKNDDPHTVPLTNATKALFGEAAAASDGDRVFAGRTGSGRETYDPKACSRAVTILMQGLKIKASAHDFRRTLATRLSELGVPDDIIERLLSHRGGRTTVTGKHYNHNDKLSDKRRALELWGRYVSAAVAGRIGPPEHW
jgi:integrase